MKRILVVGGGFAGLRIAKKLGATLITDSRRFVFLPQLPEFMRRSTDGVSTHIEDCHEQVMYGRVTKVDPDRRVVFLDGKEVAYDVLVLATGARALVPVAGAKTYAQTLYSLEDVAKLRKRLPSKEVVIVGGGPTGIEMACELAPHAKNVTLLERSQIIKFFHDKARTYARRRCSKEGVTIIEGVSVSRVTSKHVIADKKYPYNLLLWTTGVQANLVPGLPAKHGYLVDDHLRVKGYENVFAAGDCAQSGTPLTAQAAMYEADLVVKNVRRYLDGKRLVSARFREKGKFLLLREVAYLESFVHVRGKLAAWLRDAYYRFLFWQYRR